MKSFWLGRAMLRAAVQFARRVIETGKISDADLKAGGIDSITEGDWTIDFHRSIFAHLQRNSEYDDIPHVGR
jgi:hypothetical protein